MNIKHAYDQWASQYDTNINKTRDLEATALQTILNDISFDNCLEIGCGTGKNTEWFVRKSIHVTSVDLSEGMLAKAREKITAANVEFIQADITTPWPFKKNHYDLVSFNLMLEHIENLDHIFMEGARALRAGGYIYIGELHPFKQYSGSKAKFETEEGVQVVQCYDHHISEFVQTSKKYGFSVVDLNEFFDNDDRSGIPRILTLLLQKK